MTAGFVVAKWTPELAAMRQADEAGFTAFLHSRGYLGEVPALARYTMLDDTEIALLRVNIDNGAAQINDSPIPGSLTGGDPITVEFVRDKTEPILEPDMPAWIAANCQIQEML